MSGDIWYDRKRFTSLEEALAFIRMLIDPDTPDEPDGPPPAQPPSLRVIIGGRCK
ncbi:hypothetical protein [Defluviicoccus vanus]|uniref:Uncharacterized protein n=1 Tax=Defluviicoccus vanus TaxID=111831 RepID=A0A7H1N0P3_9PROT|nr:hypothetical protein [Defluviicoccus vanus]QNT69279.1 hypothetical protein HQ394_08015 [Defluviicoccus vanus]